MKRLLRQELRGAVRYGPLRLSPGQKTTVGDRAGSLIMGLSDLDPQIALVETGHEMRADVQSQIRSRY
jgi:hypothetical protein